MNTSLIETENHDIERPARRPRRLAHRAGAALLACAIGSVALVGLSSSANAAGVTGQAYRSAATCRAISSPVQASQDQISVAAPQIYAANTTAALDAQMVSFRQRVIKWNGSAWVNTGQYSAVWTGFATDQKAALDFSSGSQTVRMPQFNFTVGKGYYAVQTDFWWNANGSSSGGSIVANAWHTPSSTVDYCTFNY